jgi:hypothetical protein
LFPSGIVVNRVTILWQRVTSLVTSLNLRFVAVGRNRVTNPPRLGQQVIGPQVAVGRGNHCGAALVANQGRDLGIGQATAAREKRYPWRNRTTLRDDDAEQKRWIPQSICERLPHTDFRQDKRYAHFYLNVNLDTPYIEGCGKVLRSTSVRHPSPLDPPLLHGT